MKAKQILSRGRAPRNERATASPYRFHRFLCSAGEWRFRAALEESVGHRFDIMLQVRVAAVLKPRVHEWEKHGRCVAQKAFDFVLVDKGTSHVRCAIELDDRTHEQRERQRRDRFLDSASRRAGLPLLRVRVRRSYDPDELGRAVRESIGATWQECGLRRPGSGRARRQEDE